MGQSKTFEFDQEDYAVAAPQDTTSELIVTAIKPPEEEEPVVSSVQKQRFPKHWENGWPQRTSETSEEPLCCATRSQ